MKSKRIQWPASSRGPDDQQSGPEDKGLKITSLSCDILCLDLFFGLFFFFQKVHVKMRNLSDFLISLFPPSGNNPYLLVFSNAKCAVIMAM